MALIIVGCPGLPPFFLSLTFCIHLVWVGGVCGFHYPTHYCSASKRPIIGTLSHHIFFV